MKSKTDPMARILSVMLALVLLLSVTGVTPLTAFAADDGLYINGASLNLAANGSGTGWSYAAATRTLDVIGIITVTGAVSGQTKQLTVNIADWINVDWQADYSGDIMPDDGCVLYFEGANGNVAFTNCALQSASDFASLVYSEGDLYIGTGANIVYSGESGHAVKAEGFILMEGGYVAATNEYSNAVSSDGGMWLMDGIIESAGTGIESERSIGINGGFVYGGRAAIYSFANYPGSYVAVHGGVVYGSECAIITHAEKVVVDGGLVLCNGTDYSDAIVLYTGELDQTGGIIAAFDNTQTSSFADGTHTALVSNPADALTWATQDGHGGVAYGGEFADLGVTVQAAQLTTTLTWGSTPPTSAVNGADVSLSLTYTATNTPTGSQGGKAYLFEYTDEETLTAFLTGFPYYRPAEGCFVDGPLNTSHHSCDCDSCGTPCCNDKSVPWDGITILDAKYFTPGSGAIDFTASFTDSGTHHVAAMIYWKFADGDVSYYRYDIEPVAVDITVPTAVIHNRAELEAVAAAPDGDYLLANEIDLSDAPWTPIAGFTGTFDGAGHTISGMYVEEPAEIGYANWGSTFPAIGINYDDDTVMAYGVGLFADATGAYIHDLTIDSPSWDIDWHDAPMSIILAGALAGYVEGGQVRGVSVTSPELYIAVYDGDLYSTDSVAYAVGGAIGLVSGARPVSGVSVTGGRVETYRGDVSYEGFYCTGGVVGASYDSVLVNLVSATDVYHSASGGWSTGMVGGIAGTVYANETLLYCLHNSYSRSNVTYENVGDAWSGYVYLGGLVGALVDSAINNYYVPPTDGGITVIDPFAHDWYYHDVGILFGYASDNDYYSGDELYNIDRDYYYGTDWPQAGRSYFDGNVEFTEITTPEALLEALNDGRQAVVDAYHSQYGEVMTLDKVFEWVIEPGKNDGWPVFKNAAAQTYTITFNPSGGSVSPASAVTGTDGKLSALPVPTRSGSYSFDGWYTAASGGTKVTTATVFTANTAIYAHWTYTGGGGSGTTHYTVSFNSNGGGAVSSQSIAYGGKVTKPANPVKEGNTFAGWYKDAALTQAYDFTAAVYTGFTLYAKWTETITDPKPPLGSAFPFIDVHERDWFYGDVEYVWRNSLMNGTASDMFSPQTALTRGMIVTILYRQTGEPSVSGLTNPFTDVAAGQYYTDAVKWAAANGIVLGYGNDTYGPNDLITREQLAAIFYRYAVFTGKEPVGAWLVNLPFDDRASISGYATEAVTWCYMKGIVNGKPGNLFDPQGTATRAESAALLRRFAEAIEED